jgi:hypothetical protein
MGWVPGYLELESQWIVDVVHKEAADDVRPVN